MISIIVPVYNSEKYLRKTLSSILNQTFGDFELILIDDGSMDQSPEICREIAEKEPRIRYIRQENQGPSAARNNAVSMAQGEYISFIDSDDIVAPDYLESLHKALKENDSDISAVLMTEIGDKEKIKFNIGGEISVMSGREALLNVLYQKDLDTTPCCMLIKKEIVEGNPFPPGRYHEDDFTSFKYYENAKQVAVVHNIKYYYVQHEGSIMHSGDVKIRDDELDAADNLEKYFEGKDEELLRAARSKKFSNYCQVFLKHPDLKTKDSAMYDKICGYLRSVRKDILKDKNTRKKNKAAAFLLLFGPGMLKIAAKITGFGG